MDQIKTTNRLLLIIIIPLLFYLAKILSFILIPLVFSMFIAVLFLPMMRSLKKKGVNKTFSILAVVAVMAIIITIAVQLFKISGKQILEMDDTFLEIAESKIVGIVEVIDGAVGLDLAEDQSLSKQLMERFSLMKQVRPTLNFINSTLTMLLMTIFFAILWLAESINLERIMNKTIIKQRFSSIKTFMKIEQNLIKFVKVKVIVSLLTGIGTGLVCYFFGLSFPIFWGLFAFMINFIQMVGSFIAVIVIGLFGFIELDVGTILLFYIISLASVQFLFGTILEPILMGKSFSINIITVLVMLMLWGYIWGVPGMILSIPLTVFFKIIFEQFPKTQFISEIISGPQKQVPIPNIGPLEKIRNQVNEQLKSDN